MIVALQLAACSTAERKSGRRPLTIGSYQNRLRQTGSGQAECFVGSRRTTNARPVGMTPRQQSEQILSSP